MANVTIMLAPCEYRDGIVFVAMGWKPITTVSIEAANVADIETAVRRMHDAFDGTHDGQIVLWQQFKRKPRGFDDFKRRLYTYQCKRNPVWGAV